MKFFVKDFSQTLQARIVIFGKQVDNDVMYHGISNQPSPAYSFMYLSNFLSFHILSDEIFCQRFLSRKSGGYTGLHLSVIPSVRPSARPSIIRNTFSSKISPQPCKLENSYLVYRSMMTCCIVGLRTSLLLLILPCIYLIYFLSIL